MPMYVYRCGKCTKVVGVIKPMADSDCAEKCPACGHPMRKHFADNIPTVYQDGYSKDLHSDALAIHPSQRAEHRERYPDVEIDHLNRPVLTSVKQADKYYDGRGVVKAGGRKQLI
ncbi:MAG: zinc ribbon domain-containing protein [Deltaproteobacteria bacterium]|nr:zinc ribbon domain-containing protein [Deltaproteobacteria bacterium]